MPRCCWGSCKTLPRRAAPFLRLKLVILQRTDRSATPARGHPSKSCPLRDVHTQHWQTLLPQPSRASARRGSPRPSPTIPLCSCSSSNHQGTGVLPRSPYLPLLQEIQGDLHVLQPVETHPALLSGLQNRSRGCGAGWEAAPRGHGPTLHTPHALRPRPREPRAQRAAVTPRTQHTAPCPCSAGEKKVIAAQGPAARGKKKQWGMELGRP